MYNTRARSAKIIRIAVVRATRVGGYITFGMPLLVPARYTFNLQHLPMNSWQTSKKFPHSCWLAEDFSFAATLDNTSSDPARKRVCGHCGAFLHKSREASGRGFKVK